MTDLLATPEGKLAVEALVKARLGCSDFCKDAHRGETLTVRRELALAIPFLRKAIAAELRTEAERTNAYLVAWKAAADFVEGK